MSITSGDENRGEAKDANNSAKMLDLPKDTNNSAKMLDLPKDTLLAVFQALDLESLVTLARTSKALNQAVQSESVWMDRCRRWDTVVALTAWRTRMGSGTALFRLLRSYSRLVGAWTHVHMPRNPRGSLIYITWGVDGLEGWEVRQMVEDGGEVTFDHIYDVQGRQDGSCELTSTRQDPSTGILSRKSSDLSPPTKQSYDELYLEGSIPGAESEGLGRLYKRLSVDVPMPGRHLAGLWTGLYYMHGWEILNLTYSNDHLEDCSVVATKVTGDPHVPSGEISFVATMREVPGDLDELLDFEIPSEIDQVQWTRYPGEGRIADETFRNPSWVPGALLVGSNREIRFVWQLHGDIDYRPLDLEASFKRKDVVKVRPPCGFDEEEVEIEYAAVEMME